MRYYVDIIKDALIADGGENTVPVINTHRKHCAINMSNFSVINHNNSYCWIKCMSRDCLVICNLLYRSAVNINIYKAFIIIRTYIIYWKIQL
jgi:hypothetical protein